MQIYHRLDYVNIEKANKIKKLSPYVNLMKGLHVNSNAVLIETGGDQSNSTPQSTLFHIYLYINLKKCIDRNRREKFQKDLLGEKKRHRALRHVRIPISTFRFLDTPSHSRRYAKFGQFPKSLAHFTSHSSNPATNKQKKKRSQL